MRHGPDRLRWAACPHCNRHKGPNLTGLDSQTGEITRLFNPRTDTWDEHFREKDGQILSLTAIGQVALQLLKMNEHG